MNSNRVSIVLLINDKILINLANIFSKTQLKTLALLFTQHDDYSRNPHHSAHPHG